MDRLELQKLLETTLGSEFVYFQPPASVSMRYPAIRYALSKIKAEHANNSLYKANWAYKLTLIDRNPDSPFVQSILQLPNCEFDRAYQADNYNHFVFTIII